jgi:hypothetical protein
MTKPVAVFRLRVIRDPGHTVRLDENSHLVLFPSSRAGISPHGRYQPNGQWRHLEVDARSTGRDWVWLQPYMAAGCRLVTMLVGSRGRVGLITPTPNGHLPVLFGGPFHVQLEEWGFVRWIGQLE